MSDLLQKVTAADIKHALMKAYSPPLHRIFFEVGNDTGTRARRWIDAVAIGIWPSTGHEIVGIEIKVSRSDWLRELKQPQKAQELMRFCTRWYLACPAGMVKPDELPATWGMLAYKDGAVRHAVTAKLLEPEPITPGFMCAVLRNDSPVDPALVEKIVTERVAEREKSFQARVDSEVRHKQQDVSRRIREVEEIIAALTKITGESPTNWNFDAKAMGAAYLFLKASGLHHVETWGTKEIPGLLKSLESAATHLRSIFEDPALVSLRAQMSEEKH